MKQDEEKKGSVKSTRARKKVEEAREPTEEEQKAAFLEALKETLGVVAYACKKTGVPRAKYMEWRAADPEFAKQAGAVDELALDFVEGKAFEEIKNGNARLIQFYLETKGKKRGFGKEEGADKKQVVVFLTKEEMEY